MIEEVFKNIFKIEVPLPQSPLKSINSYIIKGSRNLIIDTGMNRIECEKALRNAFVEIKIDLHKTDFLITHMHADHSGLIKLATCDSKVYFSKEEAPFIAGLDWDSFWEQEALYAEKHGFPLDGLKDAITKHPGYKYAARGGINAKIEIIDDKDVLIYNGFLLQCIKTPGHTKGHICLYEKNNKILFSGDHVLQDITPNISAAYENDNPLKEYLNSLDKIAHLDVNLILPGHRRIFKNLNQRINELKNHHKNRLNEILNLLDNKEAKSAYYIASKIHWDIKYKNWESFPIPQKWFAHSEAIAHLQYLKQLKQVESFVENGIYLFIKL